MEHPYYLACPNVSYHYCTEHQKSPSEESQIKDNSSTSNFNFVTYTASPQDAGPKIQKFVRRGAMLHYRRQEREQKSELEVEKKFRASCSANHPFPEAKKVDDKVFRRSVADNRTNSALPATTDDLLPKEITAVDPFNAFPIKIEPYMLELLSSCECPLPHPYSPLSSPCSLLSALCISREKGWLDRTVFL